ncbi:hypothetical protein CsSME_00007654 [Camellia sinensis var. sinensis]
MLRPYTSQPVLDECKCDLYSSMFVFKKKY